ncbi:MAG: ABC transporter permease [Candidatus Limnocylindrales bacterium]
MLKYIIRRTLEAIPVLIGISFACFFVMYLAGGNPAGRFAQNPRVTQEQIEAFKHKWGLDQPWPIQYCKWLGACGDQPFLINALPYGTLEVAGLKIDLPGGDNGVIHGDLGYSINDGRPVADVIAERIPPTLILTGTAWVIWIIVAFIAGVYAAVRRYSAFDSAFTIFNYVGFSLPTFWLGLMLIAFFAVPPLKWFPASGMWDARTVPIFGTDSYWQFFASNPGYALTDLARHLVLPVFTLVAVSVAYDSRFIRSSMLDALNQDYVRTARAKGLPERRVVFRHALRNAMLPVVTNMALEIPFLFTGAIVTETIFSWPGMGRQFIQSVGHTDTTVLMGILLVTASIVVFANLLADILYGVVDPRVRYD